MSEPRPFRVCLVDLDTGTGEVALYGDHEKHLGGSGLAAALYEEYGLPREDAHHPGQPLIFAIGPLTGYFPLMSKVVCAFKSPHTQTYAESHAGGRLALAMRFSRFDALVFRGRAPAPSAAVIGSRRIEVHDVHYLWGMDVFHTGKLLRKMFPAASGHRSILRIGPAGENETAFGCINVDTFRHFGRMGCGSVMGGKNVKGIVVQGDANFNLPEGKEYAKLYKEVYGQLTDTKIMKKYHDLGTPQNLLPLNELSSLPWRNLQSTAEPGVEDISGERFAEQLLLRNAACAGCPVGCIHVGMLRERFSDEHRFQYRLVSYDYELIFSLGSMLGMDDASKVLALIDEVERIGADAISAGVALAWATEALDKGVVSTDQTLADLAFGDAEPYKEAIAHLGRGANEFYRRLGQGALAAADHYGGGDFACVLGQEMAGYATGEVYFTSQALGLRHSHLDAGAYGWDQSHEEQDADAAVDYLVEDEKGRVMLTCMVACLFSRSVYTPELLTRCLESLGLSMSEKGLDEAAQNVQKLRWRVKFATGYDPDSIRIPERFKEVVTWKGPIDEDYLSSLRKRYTEAISSLGK